MKNYIIIFIASMFGVLVSGYISGDVYSAGYWQGVFIGLVGIALIIILWWATRRIERALKTLLSETKAIK